MYQDVRCPEDSTKSPRTTALSLITFRRSSRSLTLGSVTLGSHPTGTCSVSRGERPEGTPGCEPGERRPWTPGGLRAARLRRGAMGRRGWGCCRDLAVGPGGSARGAGRGLADRGEDL